jgi:hypothetical protein
MNASGEPNSPEPARSTPSPLDEILDDLEPVQTALEWACDQLLAGETADSVSVQLISQGWDAELAEELAETARRATRRERGVVTRNDVVAEERQRFQRGTGLRWFSGWPTLASLWRVLASLGWLRDHRLRTRHDDRSGP